MLGDSLDRLADDALIVDPWVERAQAPKPKRRWAVTAIVSFSLAQAGLLAGLGWVGMHYYEASHRAPAEPTVAEAPALKDEVEHKASDDRGVMHAPLVTPPVDANPNGSVPQDTERTDVGTLKVVELGVKIPSLKQALAAELASARASGKDVLVMVGETNCDPCKGVLKSIPSDLMQHALAPVVLVRVDLEVFEKELQALHLEQIEKGHVVFPAFFLLGPDGTPRDAINGGEWDEDIAENIAPVLGPFVRGEYDKKKRKSDWKKPLPQGVFL